MKQKIIIISSIILLLTLVAFMVKDFFFSKPENRNPYEFELNKVRSGDTSMAAYSETGQFKTTLEEIHGLATDASGKIYVSGKDGVEIYDPSGKVETKFKINDTAQSIAISENGNIFLGVRNHIEIWTNAGKLLSKWPSFGPDAVITSIAINHSNGEVFFGTDKGIISFKGQSTEGSDDFSGTYVFPNPVRENYQGDITITGLVEDVNVKITDISGNLVFETKALGGQAIWDGKNFNGQKVHTGVYLVFCSNEDGSKTFVTKLLFIH